MVFSNVSDGVANWGVKFEMILLRNFHPIFLPIFLFESGFTGFSGFSEFSEEILKFWSV
jgi:hypothetical protein